MIIPTSLPYESGSDVFFVWFLFKVCFLPFSMPCNLLLKTIHDVLGKRNWCKVAFINVVVRCGREAFCRPTIRSQSFSEFVLLGSDFHKGFSVFLPLMWVRKVRVR